MARQHHTPSSSAPEGSTPGLTIEQVRRLIQMVEDSDVHELTIEREGVKLTLRKPTPVIAPGAGMVATIAQNGQSASPIEEAAAEAPAERARPAEPEHLQKITAHLVGVYRTSARRGAKAAVSVGEKVRPAQMLAAIEALNVMNEVEAPAAGVVTEIVAREGQPVEYGQHIMTIDTSTEA
ncbi:MAG TPA: biotin/lipoyl-containing protein [Ktedonobacterales bacterium]|jgi:acetyl-CoA carboxylase biotin carboxyl carrier protein